MGANFQAQVSHLMGTKVGTQKVQDDLMRQNRILERKIKALEFALKAERYYNTREMFNFQSKEFRTGDKGGSG